MYVKVFIGNILRVCILLVTAGSSIPKTYVKESIGKFLRPKFLLLLWAHRFSISF
jgi:hypothetical protein